jgi:hypothetical protein
MSIVKMVDYEMQCPDCQGRMLKDENSDTFWCEDEKKWLTYDHVEKVYEKRRKEIILKLNNRAYKKHLEPWTIPNSIYRQFKEEKSNV